MKEEKVEIVNNLGEKKMVSKEFAEAFKKAKLINKKRSTNSDNQEEIPIWDFSEDMRKELKGIGVKLEEKEIKKSEDESVHQRFTDPPLISNLEKDTEKQIKKSFESWL